MADQIYIDIEGNQVEMLVSKPDGDGPYPALVVAQHLPADQGLLPDPFCTDLMDRYAQNGYACAMPYLFQRQPLERERMEKRKYMHDDEVMVDITAAYDWLASQDYVDSNRIGIIGHCFGGRITVLALTRDPNYKVGIDFWGGGVEAPWGEGMPAPLDGVTNISAPLGGFFGNEDQNPSPEHVDALEEALKSNGKDYEFTRYDGAGHAFQDFNREERYRKEQSEDCWEKAVDFLNRKL